MIEIRSLNPRAVHRRDNGCWCVLDARGRLLAWGVGIWVPVFALPLRHWACNVSLTCTVECQAMSRVPSTSGILWSFLFSLPRKGRWWTCMGTSWAAPSSFLGPVLRYSLLQKHGRPQAQSTLRSCPNPPHSWVGCPLPVLWQGHECPHSWCPSPSLCICSSKVIREVGSSWCSLPFDSTRGASALPVFPLLFLLWLEPDSKPSDPSPSTDPLRGLGQLS